MSAVAGTPTRVSFSTGSIYPIDVAEAFRLAARAGFDGVEVLCDERWSTRDPRYLREESQRHSLPILSLHTPFGPSTKPSLPGWQDCNTQTARIRMALALAESLGAETLVVHLPLRVTVLDVRVNGRRHVALLPWAPTDVRDWILEELPRVSAVTAVRIAVENMPARRILGRRVDAYWRNDLRLWPTAHTDLTLDVTHWATWGVGPTVARTAAGARLRHVHLSNHTGGAQHRQLDDGDLDLRPLLGSLGEERFPGVVCVELDPAALPLTDTPALEVALSRAAAFCREHLGQAGSG